MQYRVTFFKYYTTAIEAENEDEAIDLAEEQFREVYGPNWDWDEVESDRL